MKIKNCGKSSCKHNNSGECLLENAETGVEDMCFEGRFKLEHSLPVLVCKSFQKD